MFSATFSSSIERVALHRLLFRHRQVFRHRLHSIDSPLHQLTMGLIALRHHQITRKTALGHILNTQKELEYNGGSHGRHNGGSTALSASVTAQATAVAMLDHDASALIPHKHLLRWFQRTGVYAGLAITRLILRHCSRNPSLQHRSCCMVHQSKRSALTIRPGTSARSHTDPYTIHRSQECRPRPAAGTGKILASRSLQTPC